MRARDLWRTTPFRLTVVYGLVYALATVALLGAVYLQSTAYLTRRVDGILKVHLEALKVAPRAGLEGQIEEALTLNGARTNVYALFTADGRRLAGNLAALPRGLRPGGHPIETPPTADFPTDARLIAARLPTGEELVVGRDVQQLREMRAIIAADLLWSGASMLVVGLACGIALSIPPLRRLRAVQAAAQDIAAGDLKRRIPAGPGRDEIDMFADTVNYMVGEVERLMSEVKSSTETIAHDLRTPLTRARARLHRLQHDPHRPEDIARVTAEIDEVLERFRAILRISELEARERRAGFTLTDLGEILSGAAELYGPLAEAEDRRLEVSTAPGVLIEADAKLLFEAVSNLVDNAIKFAPSGGEVRLYLEGGRDQPRIVIEDNGLGIPPGERSAVQQRFYRAERDRLTPGSGLGLSVVAAIVRLHGFELSLEDAQPGLRAVIHCRPRILGLKAPAGFRP